MRKSKDSTIPWYFQLLIVLYVYHTTLPAFGYYTPAVVHIFATFSLYVLLMVHEKQFLNDVRKIVPIFFVNILSILYFGLSHAATDIYGLLQLFLYPLLTLYLIRKADLVVLKRVAFWVLLSYVITSITTYYGCIRFPQASRELATGLSEDQELHSIYLRYNIGGFNFIYTLVLLLPIIIYSLRHRTIPIFWGLFIVLVLAFTIIQSEYSTALLLLMLSLPLFVFPKSFKSKHVILYFTIVSIVIFAFESFFPLLLNDINRFFESELISARLEELSSFSFFDGKNEGDVGNRYERILLSIDSFMRSPIWGSVHAVTGSHSFFFDNLGKFGLIGLGGMIIMFRQLFRLFYKSFKHQNSYGTVLFVLILVSLMLVLNPKDYLSVLTFIVPILFIVFTKNTYKRPLKK